MSTSKPLATVRGTLRVAVYARYSCDKQDDTSLEDQIRRCRELASMRGLILDENLTYTDAAMSGVSDQRDGYRRMMTDWSRGSFDVLMVDEFSRLSRDAEEQARLMKRLEHQPRVRLITADGIDTLDGDWQLRLGIQGVIAQYERTKLRFRVMRGMEGRLIRGYMLAAPAFGYDLHREFDAQQTHIGSRWVINTAEAELVREMYQRRAIGQSLHHIAAWLNASGVPCTRKARTERGGFWRPSRIRALLNNPIYRGVYVHHGSIPYRCEQKKKGLEAQPQEFARPELRLVSDELWFTCVKKSISRSGYGGGKHALSGLITCGCCAATLNMSATKKRSVFCPACTLAKSANGETHRLTQTVLEEGVQTLLKMAVLLFMSPELLTAYQAGLRRLMMGDQIDELNQSKKRLAELRKAQQRLSHMLTQISEDDDILMQRYDEVRQKIKESELKVQALESKTQVLDEQVIAAQLRVRPVDIVDKLFTSSVPGSELRAVLSRLFPSIVFEGKTSRFRAHFRIRFSPGVALAMGSGTHCLSTSETEGQFVLTFRSRAKRDVRPRWEVELAGELRNVSPE